MSEEKQVKSEVPAQVDLFSRGLSFLSINEKYLCVDLETTGLDPEESEIIEMYWCLASYDGEKLSEIESGHKLYFSEDSKKTEWLHKIPASELAGLPKFEDANNERFIELLKDSMKENSNVSMMAQYAVFEMSFFEKYIPGIKFNKASNIYDTREAGRVLYPNEPHNSGAMAERYGIQPTGQWHRAESDVKVMMGIAVNQMNELADRTYDSI